MDELSLWMNGIPYESADLVTEQTWPYRCCDCTDVTLAIYQAAAQAASLIRNRLSGVAKKISIPHWGRDGQRHPWHPAAAVYGTLSAEGWWFVDKLYTQRCYFSLPCALSAYRADGGPEISMKRRILVRPVRLWCCSWRCVRGLLPLKDGGDINLCLNLLIAYLCLLQVFFFLPAGEGVFHGDQSAPCVSASPGLTSFISHALQVMRSDSPVKSR